MSLLLPEMQVPVFFRMELPSFLWCFSGQLELLSQADPALPVPACRDTVQLGLHGGVWFRILVPCV